MYLLLTALDSTTDMAIGIERFLGWNIDIKIEVCISVSSTCVPICKFNSSDQMIFDVMNLFDV